jgi:hypothetical protein
MCFNNTFFRRRVRTNLKNELETKLPQVKNEWNTRKVNERILQAEMVAQREAKQVQSSQESSVYLLFVLKTLLLYRQLVVSLKIRPEIYKIRPHFLRTKILQSYY